MLFTIVKIRWDDLFGFTVVTVRRKYKVARDKNEIDTRAFGTCDVIFGQQRPKLNKQVDFFA